MSLLSNKYKNLITLIFLCVISLIFSWSYSPKYEGDISAINEISHNPIKSSLSLFIVPNQIIEHTISYISDKMIDAGVFIADLFRKPRELEEFNALRYSLESINYQLEEERQKTKNLEKLWKFQNSLIEVNPSFDFLSARVIAVEPTDWFRYVTINKGRNQGISVDMAVMTQAMYPPPKSITTTKLMTGVVVGKISSIQANTATVQLITDRLSVVAVTIGPQRDLALLKGRPEKEDCTIEEVPSTTHDMLSQGDPVIVDDRSSIFPPGMLVGWITSIEKKIQFCHIEVKPAFKFSRLTDVIVVLNSGY
ncbi:TPA: rod shape-determining protein MreC [bacterium]|nr:rod shape-determining protein MreC [bacterium]